MKSRFPVLFFALLHTFGIAAQDESYPTPPDGANRLFYIQRTGNTNTIVYDANVDGKAVVKAKVWKKADKEPTEWTLELTDPQPNKVGAPGLFGNATNAEVYIDNVTVTPNN